MITTLRSLVVLAASLAAFSARAESPAMPAESTLLATLDTNHDGVLSAAEIADAPWALAALDRNGDGVISPDERRVAAEPMGVRRELETLNLLVALDTNHDGILEWSEITNAEASLESLDRNGDGWLTRRELRVIVG